MDKGHVVHHLSERGLELNQKHMTYGRGREHPFSSTLSVDWFWHYVAKCPDRLALASINRKNIGRSVRRQFVQVVRQRDEVKKERRSGRREEERRKITPLVSIGLDCWPPPSANNFFYITVLFLTFQFSISHLFACSLSVR